MSQLEQKIIGLAQKYHEVLIRLSLFIIYFWFGFLKLIDVSPANPLVEALQHKTLPFLTFHQFIYAFAIFEMLIGILFLFKKFDRLTIILFAAHMVTTIMPLIFLPQMDWQSPFVPTLEGQYIIKNLALISMVVVLVSKIKPVFQKS